MTNFAIWLNELTPPGLEQKLAPTDCRLRPDQHFLEEGVYDQVHGPSCFYALPSMLLCLAVPQYMAVILYAVIAFMLGSASMHGKQGRNVLCGLTVHVGAMQERHN